MRCYDAAIIGGGLAGLSLSILLTKQGKSVLLIEKETYPFHKVCGEYISMESWPFLCSLGLALSELDLPQITELQVTAPNGSSLQQQLPLGGFGISRFTLDQLLKTRAEEAGVAIMDGTKATDIIFNNDKFTIHAGNQTFESVTCFAAYGKKSNIDIQLNRPFTRDKKTALNNFIGIKYHVKADLPPHQISLHNFKDGYCGISRVDDDKYCLCYLTTAKNLRDSGNSVDVMESTILSENKYLKDIFANSTKINEKPYSIAQISFEKKTQVEDHIIMLGDAAGMITPLCGNGMSMAMHAAKIAAEITLKFLDGEISRTDMEQDYTNSWNKEFAGRLRVGRLMQKMFGRKITTNIFVTVMKRLPWLTRKIIRQTHGMPF